MGGEGNNLGLGSVCSPSRLCYHLSMGPPPTALSPLAFTLLFPVSMLESRFESSRSCALGLHSESHRPPLKKNGVHSISRGLWSKGSPLQNPCQRAPDSPKLSSSSWVLQIQAEGASLGMETEELNQGTSHSDLQPALGICLRFHSVRLEGKRKGIIRQQLLVWPGAECELHFSLG